jgi:hypothetical protein
MVVQSALSRLRGKKEISSAAHTAQHAASTSDQNVEPVAHHDLRALIVLVVIGAIALAAWLAFP